MHIASNGPETTHMLWFVNLTLINQDAWEAVKSGIEGIYEQGLVGLEKLAKAKPERLPS